MTSKDRRLSELIGQFDQGKLPQTKSQDEAAYVRLITDLKAVGWAQLHPDAEFVDKLEQKLTEGGETKMKTFWQNVFSWPVVAAALVIFAVVTVAIPGGVVPMPP